MTAYYNERDPFAAQWLRNLIRGGHIAPGEVDDRSITEISADDLRGFRQCHFFAGIGVWSHALREAGWPDDVSVWTGSCPCQPFSAAGKQKGFNDERHLWPAWFGLIAECRPAIVLGEQVAGALDWLDLVSADLEGADYAFGASDLCAAGFGGAHIRQRNYFVAHAYDARLEGWGRVPERPDQCAAGADGVADGLAEPDGRNASAEGLQRGRQHGQQPQDGSALWSGDSGTRAQADGLGNARCEPDERRRGLGDLGRAPSEEQGEARQRQRSGDADCGSSLDSQPHAPPLGRNPADWLYCRDAKWRPVEPGTFPLADAAPQRVGRLRAYGNALDAETAAEFCGAVAEILGIQADARIAA